MPVSLAQAQLDAQDAIQAGVIENVRKSSFLLDNMEFDEVVEPGGSGSTLTYGYNRELTEGTASFRSINEEYTADVATKEQVTVSLKIFGGKFDIDRVIVEATNNARLVSELDFQLSRKIRAVRTTFHDTVINGAVAINVKQFDGLNTTLAGTSTEYNTAASIDLSSSANITSNYHAFLDAMDLWFALLNGTPGALLMNGTMKAKLNAVARRAGYYTQSEDAFGRPVDTWRGVPVVDLMEKPNSSNPIIGTVTRDLGSGNVTGLTDIYAVTFGIEDFHGITLNNGQLIKAYLDEFKPTYQASGAVRSGELEMLAATVLKRTRSAGVFRNIKVS